MNPSNDPPSDRTPWPPPRADRWVLRTRTLTVDRLPLLAGVLNVTPDSFSDGGRFVEPAAAIEHALDLVAQGADLVDIGGQSTRPYSTAVGTDEELRRVMPVLGPLCRQLDVPVSIDTTKAAVAREAVRAGAEVINDITALSGDPEMLTVALETGVGLCAMHMQGTPQTMQDNPSYDNLIDEVSGYLEDRRDALRAAGIKPDRIALDPGIGFGKTTEHNLELLRGAWRLHALGCPLLVGPSRKGFIGQVLGDAQADRTPGTIGVALSLARQGVQILRVHDVAAVRQALVMFEAGGGLGVVASG